MNLKLFTIWRIIFLKQTKWFWQCKYELNRVTEHNTPNMFKVYLYICSKIVFTHISLFDYNSAIYNKYKPSIEWIHFKENVWEMSKHCKSATIMPTPFLSSKYFMAMNQFQMYLHRWVEYLCLMWKSIGMIYLKDANFYRILENRTACKNLYSQFLLKPSRYINHWVLYCCPIIIQY